MCGENRVSGPETLCPDGSQPVNLGSQPRVTGEPQAARNYRQINKAPEYVQKGTQNFASKKYFDLKEFKVSQALDGGAPPAGGEPGGLDLGGAGGPGGEKKGLPPRPKDKRVHTSEEFKMMTDSEGENSDIKSIEQSCQDLEIDN